MGGLFNGISIGAVLLIVALGLAIVFGLMGVINLAHGELMMLGAYTTYVVQNSFKVVEEALPQSVLAFFDTLPLSFLDFYIFAALPLSFLVAALVGIFLERSVIRYLYGRPLETLLATWGVSLILRQFVRSVNWAMVVGIVFFCVLYFGGRWGLRRTPNWSRIESLATAILVMLSGAIALASGILLNRQDTLAKLWFSARNVDVTAPTWLRGGLAIEDAPRAFSAMLVALLLFGALFWGGRWMLRQKINWEKWRWLANPVLLIASIAIAFGVGAAFYRAILPIPGPALKLLRAAWFTNETGLQFPYARLFIISLTMICLGGVYWFLNGTAWGLRIRAVTQNRGMSSCLGIPTDRVDALTFALGSGLAGIAGCAVTLLGSVGPNLGGNYIVDAFMVVVVGGVGKLVGSIVAALVIGIVTYLVGSGTLALLLPAAEFLKPIFDFFTFFATTSMAKVMVFALIIAFLQVRPAGIFPQKGRAVEL